MVELVNKLAAIIDQMRMFVRRTDFSADDVCDVNTAMHGVFKMVGQQLRDNGFEVEMELEETLPLARANVVKLEQVLMNLISNARDAVAAHRTSGRALVVRTRLVERAFDENPGVAIEVQDNGPGISPAIRGRLIEPFFTTKQPGAGTGLGLSISHRIMAECGGRIEIESEEGQGALFRVVVPVPPAN